MTSYTDVFGGATIYPSEITYRAVALGADQQLSWPAETSAATDFATRIMDVSASGSYSLTMPDAREAAPGQTVLFNNVGASDFLVKTFAGVQVASIAAGTAWQIYLSDNTSAAGSWVALQYGASLSQANASALAGTGLVATGSLLSQSVPVTNFNSDYTATSVDRAKMFVWSGAGGTLTLPPASTAGNNWFLLVRNSGSGALVLDPSDSSLIDGSSTKSYQPEESSIVVCDGVAYYTLGYGQSATFAFDFTSVAVAGTGDYTLSGAELNRIAYRFTGLLTGTRNVLVPATVQQYWVDNSTTGAFDLVVKTAAGSGLTIGAGTRAILYCDGVNVVNASTAGIAVPVSVAAGGTGATTASAARINLGATSLGNSLFTAADSVAAYAALGPIDIVGGGAF
jgi:hypothetical protein